MDANYSGSPIITSKRGLFLQGLIVATVTSAPFLNTTNVYGLTSHFVKCECVHTSRTEFESCLWLAYVHNAEVLECGVQAIYIIYIQCIVYIQKKLN